uniref:Uncharacterized protein n=1 Tax=Arion vulgaris TaxID=1028688 RepID=A0A0B7BL33_9EUPU
MAGCSMSGCRLSKFLTSRDLGGSTSLGMQVFGVMERADMLASTASIVEELEKDKEDILQYLRDCLLDEDKKLTLNCSSRTGI